MSDGLMALLEELRGAMYGPTPEGCCQKCKQPFSDANVFSPAGWRETKLSGLCETCWDAEFESMGDE